MVTKGLELSLFTRFHALWETAPAPDFRQAKVGPKEIV